MSKINTVVLGGGCFWCTEAVFQEVNGVLSVESGYSGGTVPGHPTYREVCSGLTGHAEVVKLSFDEEIISLSDIILIFMTTHDPTTLNRQGADVGTMYRSVIFYNDESEKLLFEEIMEELNPYYDHKIVTELSPFEAFYKADQEHQDYYRQHPQQGYCTYVINPKLNKLRQLHGDKLKTNASS